MNGELAPGTYRSRTGALIHCREDYEGHTVVEIEDQEGHTSWGDVTSLRGAVRLSDDPDWPISSPRVVGTLHFD
jgi:L-alanine-DL-glutamate epimerase-like enolase superfamily enzyme